MRRKTTRETTPEQLTVKRYDKAKQSQKVKCYQKSSPSIHHKNKQLFQPHLSYDILYTESQRSSAVEQRFRKPQVVGSNPTVGSSFLVVLDGAVAAP